MRRWATCLLAAAAFSGAAAQRPRAVVLPAEKFGAAPLQVRFDESGKRVVVDTLVGSCEFAFDPLFSHPEGPIPCAGPGEGRSVVGSPTGSAIIGIRDGRLKAFRRADGQLKEVAFPNLPPVGAVVPIGTRRRTPRILLRVGPPDHGDSEQPVVWRLAIAEREEAGPSYALRRSPIVSDDERTVALVQENAVVAVEDDGTRTRFTLPGNFGDAVLSADGAVGVAWESAASTSVTIGGAGRPSCTASTGHAVRFVVASPSGRRILVIGDYTAATLLDGSTCAVLREDVFQARPLNFISSANVEDDGSATGVILEGVMEGFRTKTRLVRFPSASTPWALEIPRSIEGASATRPALGIGHRGRFLVHTLKGVALVRVGP